LSITIREGDAFEAVANLKQRFRSYNLPLATASPEVLAWMKKMWSDPTLRALGKDYFEQAKNPETLLEKYNDIFKGNPDVEYGLFEEDWEFKSG
jgi:hypothetical protein